MFPIKYTQRVAVYDCDKRCIDWKCESICHFSPGFFAGLLLVLLKRYNAAFKYVFSYCIMYGGECLLMMLPQNAMSNFVIVISSVLRRFIPYFMVGSVILETTTAGMFLPETVDCFDEGAWYALVDFLTVYSKDDVRFTFKNGMEIQV